MFKKIYIEIFSLFIAYLHSLFTHFLHYQTILSLLKTILFLFQFPQLLLCLLNILSPYQLSSSLLSFHHNYLPSGYLITVHYAMPFRDHFTKLIIHYFMCLQIFMLQRKISRTFTVCTNLLPAKTRKICCWNLFKEIDLLTAIFPIYRGILILLDYTIFHIHLA